MSIEQNTDLIDGMHSDPFTDDIEQDEQDRRNAQARKRIEDLMEQKRLKELLDDSEDW